MYQFDENRVASNFKNDCSVCFENTSIKDIVIPQNVFNISCWAFDECKKLEDVVFQDTGSGK